jgi:anthranilate synthase component 1
MKQLKTKKENSEHVMLVDLARNDLSRNGHDVKVKKYREVQFFSHVIHLVSKVSGYLHEKATTMQVVADIFPANVGLKHDTMQLIESTKNKPKFLRRHWFYGF